MQTPYLNDEGRKQVCKCGKICFDKKSALSKRNFLERIGRERLRIYSCPESNWWHLTKIDRYKK